MKKFYFLLILFSIISVSKAQVITFSDTNLESAILLSSPSNNTAKDFNNNFVAVDVNENGLIELSEALLIKELYLENRSIVSLEGIGYFVNLTSLDFNFNQVSNTDLSALVNLEKLHCSTNQITSLLDLNLSPNVNLNTLDCSFNSLTDLDLSIFTGLTYVECSNNFIQDLNLTNLHSLTELYCVNNQLTALNVSDSEMLNIVDCFNNYIQTLDFSHVTYGSFGFSCDNNQLRSLFVKNGQYNNFNFSGNPTLEYICVDEAELDDIQAMVSVNGYSNCVVNSYCSFVPGGRFYTIQGNSKFDDNNNGCDVLDSTFQNLKFSISEGINSGTFISDTSGNYSIAVQAGTHTITPVLENPSYFSVSPANVVVDFPTQPSPFTQNFCLTANGVHQDLEVVLLPTNPVRPGFDSYYALTYKNKGNQIQSGAISLSFEDSKMDLLSASPMPNTQSVDNMSWDFTNLQPFETRVIYLTMNINAPTDTPAVNIGDQLNFTATITPMVGDEVPYDNISAIKQIVVGSYDPNDKTCLEGDIIAPSEVGKYVHYVIRFENTGTYPAENIVVKDMIDTAKFDINTLVPIKGSHSFVTNITSGNKVEFIFENINLPFDDANNDGYVAFKIKTKPTLVNGDTFSNSANIYFDYNFPIVTNTATTTIQALSTQDFEFGQYFNVYPNPVNTVLNIDTKQTIEVSSISIYNQLGQLVVVVPSAQNVKTVDVSSLASGNYFIKINSDKGTSNAKFIKR